MSRIPLAAHGLSWWLVPHFPRIPHSNPLLSSLPDVSSLWYPKSLWRHMAWAGGLFWISNSCLTHNLSSLPIVVSGRVPQSLWHYMAQAGGLFRFFQSYLTHILSSPNNFFLTAVSPIPLAQLGPSWRPLLQRTAVALAWVAPRATAAALTTTMQVREWMIADLNLQLLLLSSAV